jgi:membrane-associated phospholipid phosphatase
MIDLHTLMKTPLDAINEVNRATSRRRSGRPLLVAVVVGAALIAAAHLLDSVAWANWRDPRVNDRDWGRMLRSVGYLPVWIVIAIGLWTSDYPGDRWKRRGGLVVLAPLLGGAVAELIKLLVRRLRPDPETFSYVFRAFSEDTYSTRGLGMPSSHVLVAFAGAAALARLFPRATVLWYLLAIGCAATRVLSLGHYLSDVIAAAVIGWFVTELLWRRMK